MLQNLNLYQGLYIPGVEHEVFPNVIVERGTKLYRKKTLKGKIQQLVFKYASVYVNSISNLDKSINLLKSISYDDSQLYYPSRFGYVTNQEKIILDVIGFSKAVSNASVWIPANGWVFDTSVKYGVIGSGGKERCYYHLAVEIQFRQTAGGQKSAVNDTWTFFIDQDAEKFYQIKEWLDGRVSRIQPLRTILNQEIFILDTNNINLIPFPAINPEVTVNSIGFTIDTTPATIIP